MDPVRRLLSRHVLPGGRLSVSRCSAKPTAVAAGEQREEEESRVARLKKFGSNLREGCVGKILTSGASGFMMGLAVSPLTFAFDKVKRRWPPVSEKATTEPEGVPLGTHAVRSATNGAKMGMLSSSVDCCFEQLKEAGIVTSPLYAVCVSNALGSAKEGPHEMISSCVSSVLFAVAMEKLSSIKDAPVASSG